MMEEPAAVNEELVETLRNMGIDEPLAREVHEIIVLTLLVVIYL